MEGWGPHHRDPPVGASPRRIALSCLILYLNLYSMTSLWEGDTRAHPLASIQDISHRAISAPELSMGSAEASVASA